MNLGLRWELHTPWVEVKNRQANFDLVTGAEAIAGQNGDSRALYNQYNGITNFQPRIGFAWTPGGRSFVLRGAYTLSSYLEGTGTNLRLPINPPFAGEHELDYTKLTTGLPGSTLDQGFTPFATADVNPFPGLLARVGPERPACSFEPVEFHHATAAWVSTTIQVGYVGQRTNHLMVPMPYFQKRLLSDGTVARARSSREIQTLVNEIGQISGTASNGNQSYNALQAVIQKRLSGGLQYSVAYTYSKCMADAIGYYGAGGQSGSQSPYWQNVYDKKPSGVLASTMSLMSLTANAVYDLPFGRNRRLART